MIDGAWQQAVAACGKMGQTTPVALWRRVGVNSGTVTFAVAAGDGQESRFVAQVFPRELGQWRQGSASSSDCVANRYDMVQQLANVHDRGDSCRFVRAVVCAPELDCVVTEYVAGVELWDLIRARCRHLQLVGLAELIGHVRSLARWLSRLDDRTTAAARVEQIVQTSAQTTIDKLNALGGQQVLTDDDVTRCCDALSIVTDQVVRQRPRSIVVHGDFCPANVLISGDGAHIIDMHSMHAGLAFEDAAYFAATLDDLSIEPWRYSAGRVRRLKDAFLAEYESSVQLSRQLAAFQTLTANVQVLNYHARTASCAAGVRGAVNRWRVSRWAKKVASTVSHILDDCERSEEQR